MLSTVSGVLAKGTCAPSQSLEVSWGETAVTQPQLDTEACARKERTGRMESIYPGAFELKSEE